jgi:hypothetical protein
LGDSETGGGGSVQWSYNVKSLKRHSNGQVGGRDTQDGADVSGVEGRDFFTVSIAWPGGLESFKQAVTASPNGNRVEFKLLIQDDPTQIKIHWPD